MLLYKIKFEINIDLARSNMLLSTTERKKTRYFVTYGACGVCHDLSVKTHKHARKLGKEQRGFSTLASDSKLKS